MILEKVSAMNHTSYGELRQLFETFTRVWGSGGQASLDLHTQDGKSRALLDIQLGPPAAPCPGAPDARGEGPGPTPGPQHRPQPQQQRPRRRGPSSRARDAARRQAWRLKKQQAAEPSGSTEQQQPPALDHQEEDISVPLEEELDTSGLTYQLSNELSCNLCDYESETGLGLKIHVGRKHKDIPQFDGETDGVSSSDGYREENDKDDDDKEMAKVSEVSELELCKETLEKFILSLGPEKAKNQLVKEISDLKVAVINIVKKHLLG